MREILGRRRKLSLRWRGQSALLSAVLTYTEQWRWPVVPGVGYDRRGSWRAAGAQPCACPRPDCPVPGVHPHDPGLMAATCDPRMVRWWWTARPGAPVMLATGDRVSAVSLPAVAGARALDTLDQLGVRLGPVVATPTRFVLLVAPYSLEELGELLDSHEWVPSSLRYHGQGGYVALPPSSSSAGQLRWIRPPVVDAGSTSPWLPSVALIVDTLVQAGRTAPDGTHLTY
ncbi:bifunctional DNA primase/polymerase [Streptomyces sp. H10-C2]|uniref:bifunctional DNA primase/polymerase n=1 Tax=unclassified Streptomyces TaxID=2593676 RepID=UPI0024B9DE2C|nr:MULTISPECIES: bifunctional DNA primase/polymerase [unclassified Streptomyces]MDJ0342084.1 bifunctional DNA primase/polymerase [Streptomyces sp. PH10-H1]MDJ0368426.1 bifunctional DNA primase/polymerase [Streptomyces sp. H10-C2]